MTDENKEPEPILPSLIKRLKSRKLDKKRNEIELLKLEIEKAKLEKALEGIRK